MMNWNDYPWFAVPALIGWGASIGLALARKARPAATAAAAGIAFCAAFAGRECFCTGHLPFQTVAEARMWLSLAVACLTLGLYARWRLCLPHLVGLAAASVFVLLNLFKPDLRETPLNPLLQSGWYLPHVVSYIMAYALLSSATVQAVVRWTRCKRFCPGEAADRCVYAGFSFLLCGLLCGALWAFQAWGAFWAWDAKETWALATATGYALYLHIRLRRGDSAVAGWVLVAAFAMLTMTWLGISYLPAAQSSLHVY